MASLPLATPISATDTTITVIGTIQNATGPGTITIESETITFLGCSADQFLSCTRGTAVPHARGVAVIYTQDPVVTLPIAQVDVTPVVTPVNTNHGLDGTLSFTGVHADIGTTSATPATTIFTPAVSGLYLLSFYGLATTAPTGADAAPNLYLAWTDEHGTQKYFNFAGNLDQTYTDGPNSVTIPVYAVKGTPIWMYTTSGNYSSTVRWSFYFKVTPA
jgi:hypothetical protein